MIRFCSVVLLGIAASSICMPTPVAAAPMPSSLPSNAKVELWAQHIVLRRQYVHLLLYTFFKTRSGSGTAVTVDGASVTISVHIDLCCLPEDASQRDVWDSVSSSGDQSDAGYVEQALAVLAAKGCYNIRVVFDLAVEQGGPFQGHQGK